MPPIIKPIFSKMYTLLRIFNHLRVFQQDTLEAHCISRLTYLINPTASLSPSHVKDISHHMPYIGM